MDDAQGDPDVDATVIQKMLKVNKLFGSYRTILDFGLTVTFIYFIPVHAIG